MANLRKYIVCSPRVKRTCLHVHLTRKHRVKNFIFHSSTLFLLVAVLFGGLFIYDKNVKASSLEEVYAFPASYQAALKSMKYRHPNWHFEPVMVDLEWDEVIREESKKGRSAIQSGYPAGRVQGAPLSYLSKEAFSYNASTKRYHLIDGTDWYYPSKQVVAYYVDPRSSLTDRGIFQFQSLSFSESEKIDVVKKILSDSFMKNDFLYKVKIISGTGKKKIYETKTFRVNYADVFYEAARQTNVSAYFLAARARLELGKKGTIAVSGNVPGYKDIYNFFNIGANDTAGGGAVTKGLYFAKGGNKNLRSYNRPWDNQYNAIIGGAQFFYESYIQYGQNTSYFQKFSVVNEEYRYWHQYMTNIQAPTVEAGKLFEAYQNLGILDSDFTFYIPVYKNMPSYACTLPSASKSSNSLASSVTVETDKGKKLTRTLSPEFTLDCFDYELCVPKDTEKLTFNVRTVSRTAKVVKGNGTFSLGKKKRKVISIVCRAEDGAETEYTIHVHRVQ